MWQLGSHHRLFDVRVAVTSSEWTQCDTQWAPELGAAYKAAAIAAAPMKPTIMQGAAMPVCTALPSETVLVLSALLSPEFVCAASFVEIFEPVPESAPLAAAVGMICPPEVCRLENVAEMPVGSPTSHADAPVAEGVQ